MLQDRIAKRYAKSLFQLSLERNILEEVKADFDALDKLYHESADMRMLLRSPVITSLQKWAILSKLLKGKLSDSVYGFLQIITRKGREALLDTIWQEYVMMYNAHKNITVVEVSAAHPLTEAARTQLSDRVAKELATTVQLRETVDPELIGGLAVQIGHRRFDGSVASALRQVKREFKVNLN